MSWRSLSLFVGVLSLIGGIALFSYGGATWLGWTLTLVGGTLAIIGIAPEQLFLIFRIPELRKKIFITLIFLAVYRIGYYVPLPMIDQAKMADKMAAAQSGALGQVLGFVSQFSGGNLSQCVIFSLGIMPYISASIIIQLLASGVMPSLERLRREGEGGRKKLNEITRYLTVPICAIQALIVVQTVMRPESESGGMGLAPAGYNEGFDLWWFGLRGHFTMTAGCVFLMWLGEQIDEYGIGNGISLIIMAGIVARIPEATTALLMDSTTGKVKESIFTLGGATGEISFEKLLVLGFLFLAVVVGVAATYALTLLLRALTIAPDGYDLSDRQLTAFISHPDGLAAVVAALAGVAGMLSLTEARTGTLVGVLVSVTTVPAIANIGLAAAYTEAPEVGGAALQLAVNVAGLTVAGIATLAIQSRLTARRGSPRT